MEFVLSSVLSRRAEPELHAGGVAKVADVAKVAGVAKVAVEKARLPSEEPPTGAGGFVGEGRETEREKRLRALRGTHPHTVGYVGGCDAEQEEIECP
jgi:hypothetical protein